MTDIRERLATEWLRHQHTGCGFCRCGHRPDHRLTNLDAQAMHFGDVLLSLPGIAIVELPAAEQGRDQSELAGKHSGMWLDQLVVAYPGRCELDWQSITPSDARALAAALLAAANAAEESS